MNEITIIESETLTTPQQGQITTIQRLPTADPTADIDHQQRIPTTNGGYTC